MIHPIFMTVLRRPDLFATHLTNYAELVKIELSAAGSAFAVRAAAGVIAFVALLLAFGLTGVAIMFGVMHGAFHWVLAVVPGIAWLLAAICAALAMRSTVKEKVADVKEELEADYRVLRMVKEARDD